MKPEINKTFIEDWQVFYDEDEIANDEAEYKNICRLVAFDLNETESLRESTFREIWRWKGANRVIRFIQFDKYESLYAEAFRRAITAPPELKLAELISEEKKLPGVGAPTGSTILHFMFPNTMPIIDIRTVEVLHKAGLITKKTRGRENYDEFRRAIELVRQNSDGFTLRQIDRALFAYHKKNFTKKARARTE
jgi:endonuclease III-like uncharacterized protein